MFTQTLARSVGRRVSNFRLLGVLTGPHGIDRYTELLDPALVAGTARARIFAAQRRTPRSVTLTLAPNAAFVAHNAPRAGQHVNLVVEIDGRRHTRCYSPANGEHAECLELTIGRHGDGLVSNHLYEHARAGMVVGLDGVTGDFVLPEPARRPSRMLFVAGGSGITPIMAMLRTLRDDGYGGELAVIHYARNAAEASYCDEIAALPGVRTLHGYTRSLEDGGLSGRFGADHLAAAMPDPDVAYVCGPPPLADAVRQHCRVVRSESFVPPAPVAPAVASGGRIRFADSNIDVTDDGRGLLDQAEGAGLSPQHGCRMGICHTCTRRKTSGAVKNLTTGAVSTGDAEDVQICVSAPVGDVEIAL